MRRTTSTAPASPKSSGIPRFARGTASSRAKREPKAKEMPVPAGARKGYSKIPVQISSSSMASTAASRSRASSRLSNQSRPGSSSATVILSRYTSPTSSRPGSTTALTSRTKSTRISEKISEEYETEQCYEGNQELRRRQLFEEGLRRRNEEWRRESEDKGKKINQAAATKAAASTSTHTAEEPVSISEAPDTPLAKLSVTSDPSIAAAHPHLQAQDPPQYRASLSTHSAKPDLSLELAPGSRSELPSVPPCPNDSQINSSQPVSSRRMSNSTQESYYTAPETRPTSTNSVCSEQTFHTAAEWLASGDVDKSLNVRSFSLVRDDDSDVEAEREAEKAYFESRRICEQWEANLERVMELNSELEMMKIGISKS